MLLDMLPVGRSKAPRPGCVGATGVSSKKPSGEDDDDGVTVVDAPGRVVRGEVGPDGVEKGVDMDSVDDPGRVVRRGGITGEEPVLGGAALDEPNPVPGMAAPLGDTATDVEPGVLPGGAATNVASVVVTAVPYIPDD